MTNEHPHPRPAFDTDESPSPGGNHHNFDHLLPTVYEELHALAASIVGRNRVSSACTTSLVQDVYVRLAGRGLKFHDQSHFLCLAARAMRMVLIDRARRERAEKRGGCRENRQIASDILPAANSPDVLDLDEALAKLALFDERKSRIVELRFFGGLSVDEAAETLGLSPATVKREWILARAWLLREIGGRASKSDSA